MIKKFILHLKKSFLKGPKIISKSQEVEITDKNLIDFAGLPNYLILCSVAKRVEKPNSTKA